MTLDLGERVSCAPRRAFKGDGYRQQSPRYEPLSGEGARLQGGRFNPPNSFSVLHLCTTRACAVAEFRRSPIGIRSAPNRSHHVSCFDTRSSLRRYST
jgi:RES domain-containing protein